MNPSADDGDGAAKQMDDYGFTLGVRLSRLGWIPQWPFLAARLPASNHLEALVEALRGMGPAAKGCIEAYKQTLLAERYALPVVTPPRTRMPRAQPRTVFQACGRGWKRLETVGAPVPAHFAVARTRAHDLWPYQHHLIRKVLAHTVAVFLNLQVGRSPLDLDGLVPA